MVITGKQPVVVDTGTQSNRREWFNDVLSLVDPDDVKFIYISHDDHDHTGNLAEANAGLPQRHPGDELVPD